MKEILLNAGLGAMVCGVALWFAAAVIPHLTNGPLRRAASVFVTGELAFCLGVLLIFAARWL